MISASTVAVIMIVAWVLIVRRACVPASDDSLASHRPVKAVSSDASSPPTMTNVAACHSSLAQAWSSPPIADNRSRPATIT